MRYEIKKMWLAGAMDNLFLLLYLVGPPFRTILCTLPDWGALYSKYVVVLFSLKGTHWSTHFKFIGVVLVILKCFAELFFFFGGVWFTRNNFFSFRFAVAIYWCDEWIRYMGTFVCEYWLMMTVTHEKFDRVRVEWK